MNKILFSKVILSCSNNWKWLLCVLKYNQSNLKIKIKTVKDQRNQKCLPIKIVKNFRSHSTLRKEINKFKFSHILILKSLLYIAWGPLWSIIIWGLRKVWLEMIGRLLMSGIRGEASPGVLGLIWEILLLSMACFPKSITPFRPGREQISNSSHLYSDK